MALLENFNFLLYLALLPVGGANHRDVDAVSRGGYVLAIIVDGRRFLPATHLAMNCKQCGGPLTHRLHREVIFEILRRVKQD